MHMVPYVPTILLRRGTAHARLTNVIESGPPSPMLALSAALPPPFNLCKARLGKPAVPRAEAPPSPRSKVPIRISSPYPCGCPPLSLMKVYSGRQKPTLSLMRSASHNPRGRRGVLDGGRDDPFEFGGRASLVGVVRWGNPAWGVGGANPSGGGGKRHPLALKPPPPCRNRCTISAGAQLCAIPFLGNMFKNETIK